jgi:hypothetical protein
MIIKMLDIHRITHNLLVVGRDGKTPAMRLGLVDRPMTVKDVLMYPEIAPPMVRAKPKSPRPSPTDDGAASSASPKSASLDLEDEIPF